MSGHPDRLRAWADKHDQWDIVDELDTTEKTIQFLADAAGDTREWLQDLAALAVADVAEVRSVR